MTWYESAEFWKISRSYIFGPQAWERAGAEVEGTLAHLGASPGARILDLCCGPGRHTLELARRGFRVTAVDLQQAHLDELRAAARERGLDVELVKADMREFRRPGAFDGALNLFTSFGYFEDPADDRRVIENLHASLRTGARLVLDMVGKELIARHFLAREWARAGDEFVLMERWIEKDLGWICNRNLHVGSAGQREVRFEHRLYSGAELRDLLAACGFGEIRLFGDFSGSPYDLAARRLLAVARR
jgi:SAM-dependent methyltransferase